MSNVPLPEPFSDMQYCRPSGVFGRLAGYTADQMHAHAAAVSAAKDAEISGLREDAKRWRALDAMLRHLGNPMTPTYRLVRTCSTFGDDRDVQDWRKEVDAARKGTTLTTQPPSPSPWS